MRCPRLCCTRALQALSHSLSWKPLGKPQLTLASEISLSGIGLHSGVPVTARLFPAMAGEGRYFVVGGRDGRWRIPARINHAVESALCTTLEKKGKRVRTVEHLLSALEGFGVDNCGIEILGGDEAKAIGCQWFSCFMDDAVYSREIASSRTFCIYEEVEIMRKAGLIQGGSPENAIICSATAGWLNPPLRFYDEPCRHKVLDLVGDFSLFAQNGNQGLPLAHIIAYKAGHSLHVEFVRRLSNISRKRS